MIYCFEILFVFFVRILSPAKYAKPSRIMMLCVHDNWIDYLLVRTVFIPVRFVHSCELIFYTFFFIFNVRNFLHSFWYFFCCLTSNVFPSSFISITRMKIISNASLAPGSLTNTSITFLNAFLNSPKPGACFSKAPETFRARKAIAKVRTLRLQSCFIHVFLIWTQVPFIQEVSVIYTSPFLETDDLKISVFTGPKSFRGFRETEPKYLI